MKIKPAIDDAEAGQVLGYREGRLVVRGRDGEELTRQAGQEQDEFDCIQPPPGWVYGWWAESVTGNSDICKATITKLKRNAWREVPAARHAEYYGTEGSVRNGPMVLMERPKALDDEARREDRERADQQIRDRNSSLGMAARAAMPEGFEMSRRYRGTQPTIKLGIDPAADVPRPQYLPPED